MSFQMQSALNFTRWLLNKHNITVPDVDDSTWKEFMQTDEAAAVSKTVVENMIPQVVEKMPSTKKKPATPRVRKTKTDAQSQTTEESVAEHVEKPKKEKKSKKPPATEASVIEPTKDEISQEKSVAEPLEKPKKEKKSKKQPTTEESVIEPTKDEISQEESVSEPTKDEISQEASVIEPVETPKKEKKSKKQPSTEESVAEPVETPKKEKKSKKQPATEDSVIEPTKDEISQEESVAEPVEKPKKEKKSKKPKDEPLIVKPVENLEVVVPETEMDQLANSPRYDNGDDAVSLMEESYEPETEFEEVYVNEVLYYVDSNDNWLDSSQTPVAKPTQICQDGK